MGMSAMDVNEKCWVLSGPAMPCGARVLGPAGDGRVWLDVCVLGQHLPQMYPPKEIHELTAEDCPRFGLCDQCFGWGDAEPPKTDALRVSTREVFMHAVRRSNELTVPCPGCGGSGRPALRVSVREVPGGLEGEIHPLPHAYVQPLEGTDPVAAAAFQLPPDMCLACGMPRDGKGPRGQDLHPA